VTGYSGGTWGDPLRAYSDDGDVFVARLDGDGILTWHTFLGGPEGIDFGRNIAVDGSSHIYLSGYSGGTWGDPLRAYSGGQRDAFVAKLGQDGMLIWNSFLGGSGLDYAQGIAVDSNSQVYVTGHSGAAWGSPLRDYSGGSQDAFVARLEENGALAWHTFLGGSAADGGYGVAVDGSGHVYLTGQSTETWGSPLRAYSGGSDAFVAKLDGSGDLTWHTFLGGSRVDYGKGIELDGSGYVYVTGTSYGTWGAPLRAYSALRDGFVAKLDTDGTLTWNTLLGGLEDDDGRSIALNTSGRIYVVGGSSCTWGSPVCAYSGEKDAFVAHIDQPCIGDGVYLYEQTNYEGRCRLFSASDPDLPLVAFNDIASSIRFVGSYGESEYVATLYEHSHYRGASSVFGANDPDFSDDDVGDDQASSIWIRQAYSQHVFLPLMLAAAGHSSP
jgi:hypothetical protein